MPPFLSDEWISQARQLADHLPKSPHAARVNLVVTGVPFGVGTIAGHLDTTGSVDLDLGHLDRPDATVAIRFDVAKRILLDGDWEAAFQGFMAGQITVDGELAKVVALYNHIRTEAQADEASLGPVQAVLHAITD